MIGLLCLIVSMCNSRNVLLFFRYNATEHLSIVRDHLYMNEMTTENVIAKYERCDEQLQGEIRNRRNASSVANLAFSIILHRDITILEHQLKLLFRPNHAFCLHVDAKAPEKILLATHTIVDCYKGHSTYDIKKIAIATFMFVFHALLSNADVICDCHPRQHGLRQRW